MFIHDYMKNARKFSVASISVCSEMLAARKLAHSTRMTDAKMLGHCLETVGELDYTDLLHPMLGHRGLTVCPLLRRY